MVLTALAVGLAGPGATARAVELLDPPVLSSRNGVLDLLIVARPAPAPAFAPYATTAWVYDICRRPTDNSSACPADAAPDPYGGARLRLNAGDELKIRLVNKLPPIAELADTFVTGDAYLALNPVNFQTEGMLVSPRFPTVDDPTYGDNAFVMTLNPANGALPPGSNIQSDVRVGHTDYVIRIPPGHPPGLFWFHPQIHGVALDQVSAGMAGVITVGAVSDYVCADAPCRDVLGQLRVRHLILKDAQVLAGGTLLHAQDPDFCDPAGAMDDPRRRGGCPGVNRLRPDGGTDYTGGRWFFTLNGQDDPSITIGPGGEIWRIANASGGASHDLGVHLPAEDRDLLVQVLAVDGVAVSLPAGLSPGDAATLGGGKFETVGCPADLATGAAPPLCVSRFLMAPGSRVELWVAYRDASGRLAPPPTGARAVLGGLGRRTGPTGHPAPAVALASVDFSGSAVLPSTPQFLSVARGAKAQGDLPRLSRNLEPVNALFRPEPDCRPLARGHHRRIFFNSTAGFGNPFYFGLGYEEVDAAGHAVPGTFRDIAPFYLDMPSVCVELGPGNTPMHERWELVNLDGEDHDFHLQQTKFMVIGPDTTKGFGSAKGFVSRPGALTHDSIPLRHARGTCNKVDDWRTGVCVAYPVMVDIAFAIAGDLVYHCDDLGHEDKGMMARVRVRAAE